MPVWLSKLVWRFRRNRLVRLHTVAPGQQHVELTIEGFLVGRWDGHYILERPRLLERADSTVSGAPGNILEIPVDRVWLREVLTKDARL